jgi:hypothetical protein
MAKNLKVLKCERCRQESEDSKESNRSTRERNTNIYGMQRQHSYMGTKGKHLREVILKGYYNM